MIIPYKLLILDYGGVYSFEYDVSNFNKIMLDTFGKIPNFAQKEEIDRYSHRLAENKISSKKYVSLVGKILDVTPLPSAISFEEATVTVTSPPTKEMVDLVSRVKDAGVIVSLLSDMYMFEIELTKPWGRYEGFDHTSFSADEKLTKSNPAFFEHTLKHFGIEAHQALFVDDVEKNIKTATSVGIKTLHADKSKYQNVTMLVKDIYRLLNIN